MPPAPLTIATLLGLTTALSIVGVALDPQPFAPEPAAAISFGGGTLSVVTIGATLLARSRWSRMAGVAMAALWFGTSIAGPLDGMALATSLVATITAAGYAGPWLGRWLRRLPAAEGPPAVAIVLLISLLATPVVAGLSQPDTGLGAAGWAGITWSYLLALLVARAVGWSLWAGRIAHLPVMAALGWATAPVLGIVLGVKAGAEVVAFWRRDISIALVPLLAPPVATVPIPPELVDPAIMEAAGLDDRGRPLDRS